MDIVLKNIPDGIGEKQATEWMAILVERFENAKLNQIKEVVQATEAAKTGIDSFRVANKLEAKFSKAEEVKAEPVEEVKEEVKPVKDEVEEAVVRG